MALNTLEIPILVGAKNVSLVVKLVMMLKIVLFAYHNMFCLIKAL